MQPAGYLVQTVHNHFMEVLYDYGAVGLIYFGALISVLKSNISSFFNPERKEKNMKLYSALIISLMFFFFIIHLTDGIRVISSIVFFSFIGVLESIRYIYQKYQVES